ncbi:F0F1 ATP synthase subunit B family protein [Blastopirellula marina]|uniref:ATP synthase subunit b n=1 Tax=Blastopirellula marina DSM 3645 TaxID=314230 RepID=A4A1A5_9BACT|nr:ATP synthase F0 subunit B [Blastopirellula marina]EAQ77457.1 probable protein ATP synthase B chain [Blastopirellula marina DSM 3645]
MRNSKILLLLAAFALFACSTRLVAQDEAEPPAKNPVEAFEEEVTKGIENIVEAEEHNLHKGEDEHAANPNDLSHNDAAVGLHNPEALEFDLATFNFLIFLGLAALLTIFAWKPIVAALDSREAAMDGKLAEAQKMFAAAEARLAEYNQKLADAQQEIQKSREQIMKEAEEKRLQILADAQAAGNAERKRAQQEIEAAKTAAISDLTKQSVNLAIDLASKITRQQLTPEDHQHLINDTLAQLPSQN